MARPIDYVLRVYPTKALALEENQSGLTALSVLGDEVTATTATSVNNAGHNTYTITAGQSLDLNLMFDIDEYLTVTGFSVSSNNVENAIITEVTASTIKVVSASGSGPPGNTTTGTLTFKQASSSRPSIDNNNQISDYTDAAGLTQQNNFFTHERMFFRFDVPVAASEFYVDWDDGEDNTVEKANYSLKKFDLPQNFAIFEHTYTKHGQFFPMLRVTSPSGFKSKYYTTCDAPRSSYRELESTHDLTATQQTGAAEQNLSVVSLDSNFAPRIPSFIPSNSPPIGVLKLDRSSVYGGIDNSIVNEALTATNTQLGVAARGYVYIDRLDTGISNVSGNGNQAYTIDELVEVVYINTNNEIRKELLPGSTGVFTPQGGEASQIHPDSLFPRDGTGLKKVISVKLRNVKENPYGDLGASGRINVKIDGLYEDERVWIRLIDNGDVSSGGESIEVFNSADGSTVGKAYPSFCNVSNGNPYVTVNDPRYRVMADGSDSIARNSNVTIAKYWLYDDKLGVRDSAGTDGAGGAKESILDSGSTAGSFIDKHTDVFGTQVESTTDPKQAIVFNHDYMRGQQLDDKEFYAKQAHGPAGGQLLGVGRFYDEFRLLRLQVEDSSEDGPNATMVPDITGVAYRSGDRMDRSFVEHSGNYKKPNGVNLAQRPGSLKSCGLLLYRNSTGVWLDLNARNHETNKLNFGGDGSRVGSTTRNTLSNTTDINTGAPANWLLTAKDKKFSKIFFRMDNDTVLRQVQQESPPHVKLVAWYTGPSGWKQLSLKDETMINHNFTGAAVGKATSLYRSGPVSWEIPEDWTPVTTSSTGYGSAWTVPVVNHTHASATTITVGAGCRITASSKQFLNVTGADTIYKAGDKISITGTDGSLNNGTYTIDTVSGNTIVTDESPGGDDLDTPIVVNLYTTVTAGVSTFGNVVPVATTPSQAWESTNWPKSNATGVAGGYGILFGILSTNAAGIQCYHIEVCDNQHSRIVRVVDPKHISLNSAMIAQSIGFSRRGKYHSIIDRLGKSEIRRIGAGGGKISFGSVSMGKNTPSEGNRTRERFVEYQKEGTPVYYDVRHNNGTYTRFFGVIDNISEDIPIGKAIPKVGVSMIVSHIIEYSSSGVFTDEVISLGGLVDTDTRYLQ